MLQSLCSALLYHEVTLSRAHGVSDVITLIKMSCHA